MDFLYFKQNLHINNSNLFTVEFGKNKPSITYYEDCADSIKDWPREETLHELLEKLNLQNNPGKFRERGKLLFI